MPIAHYAYYAQYAYYAHYAHPPKNTNGGDTPRAGAKRVQPPFTPMRDASPPLVLALCASVLSLSLMSAFTPRSSFRCPSPWRPIQTPHRPELRRRPLKC